MTILKKRLEHLERYSREFNIRVLGVNEDEGEDCISKILDFITSLGFEDVAAEVENAHRTGNETISQGLLSRSFTAGLLKEDYYKQQRVQMERKCYKG